MGESMTTSDHWTSTACILCSLNCGLEVQIEDGHFKKIKGDKKHPISKGYLCQKASQLEYYQHGKHRLTHPLRKRPDGTFEQVSWDTAISEVAAKLKDIRDTHGGHTIAQYGGGGQGNHLGGAYSVALRAAVGTRYLYSSLAQEKTGGFWLNGRLFGRQGAVPISDHHESDFIMAIGWNPWQSHGMPRARKVLQEWSKDPNRTFVVIDPRRTETADKADYHLQVRPGGDAHLLLAMLGYIVQEGLEDKEFIANRCVGFDELRQVLEQIPVDDYCREAKVDPDLVKDITRKLAAAKGAAIHTDLGIEQTLHSTLNLYLSKLLWLITGNFAIPGGQLLFPPFVPLVGNSKEPQDGGRTTKVAGMREIGKLYPPNSLPGEIDTDHPDRLRALYVDSSNPVMTAADGHAIRKAFEKLELLVVIDVAMTETARMADYILPASSQYEKWECTFFNFAFPDNAFHLRAPLFEPQSDTLPEPEIYRRLVVAMGELPDEFPDLEKAAHKHVEDPSQGIFPLALMTTLQEHPEWSMYLPLVLYSTLGKALPNGAASAAILWAATQRFAETHGDAALAAGIQDEGAGLGEALFSKILTNRSGVIFSRASVEDSWNFVTNPDQKIRLVVPEMFLEIEELEREERDTEYPYVLQAGERRSYNANQIMRTADWRKKDREGALRVHPSDARTIGLEDGGQAELRSKNGAIFATVEITDAISEGFMSLPHGYGMIETMGDDGEHAVGANINILSGSDHCDRIAATPYHKYIPVAVVPAMVPAK